MTNLQIQKMKDTGCLELTKWQLFWHYSIIYILIIVSVITTITTVHLPEYSAKSTSAMGLFLYRYIGLILAVIFYFIQTKRLKFKTINISADEDKFKDAAIKTSKELNWKIIRKTNDIVIAKSSFSWISRGELITIIRDDERILINSICDPDKWPSVMSYGTNKENRETYERFVRDSN